VEMFSQLGYAEEETEVDPQLGFRIAHAIPGRAAAAVPALLAPS
jgi:hypothetical protein